jgi:hypothetical protein
MNMGGFAAPLGRFIAFYNNGAPLSGGELHTYKSGSDDKKKVYAEWELINPLDNPVLLDSAGRADVWLENGPYKFILKDKDGVEIYTADPVFGNGGNSDVIVMCVDTIAQLRALAANAAALVFVNGYYERGDGGGGNYLWMAEKTDTDDGGMIIEPNSAPAKGRWIGMVPNGKIDVARYGVVGDGVVENSSFLEAAATYANDNEMTLTLSKKIVLVAADCYLANVPIEITAGCHILIASSYKITSLRLAENYERKVISCNSEDAPLLEYNTPNPKMFGAEADNNNDDWKAITCAIKALMPSQASFYMPDGLYKITAPVEFKSLDEVRINLAGTIKTVHCSGISFENVTNAIICVNRIQMNELDWTTDCYGIRIKDIFQNNKLTYNTITGYKKGLHLTSVVETDFQQYDDEFRCGNICDCRYGIIADAPINNINFYGGHICLNAETKAAIDEIGNDLYHLYSYATHITGITQGAGHGVLRFYAPVFELLNNGMHFNALVIPLLIQPVFKSIDENLINVEGGDLMNGTWITGDIGQDWTKIHFNSDCKGWSIIGPRAANTAIRAFATDAIFGGFSFFAADQKSLIANILSGIQDAQCWMFTDYWCSDPQYMNKAYENTESEPTQGTYGHGAVVWNRDMTEGETIFWQCSGAGTMDTISGITATTDSTSYDVEMSDVTGLRIGQYLNIAEVSNILQIQKINTTTKIVTMYQKPDATKTTKAVTNHPAEWIIGPFHPGLNNRWWVGDMFTDKLTTSNGPGRGWFNPSDANNTIGTGGQYGYCDMGAGGEEKTFDYTYKNDGGRYFLLTGFENYIAIPNTLIKIGTNEYTVIISQLNTVADPNIQILYVKEDISGEAATGTISSIWCCLRLFATFGQNATTKIQRRAVFPTGHVKISQGNISLEEGANKMSGTVTYANGTGSLSKVISNTAVTANSRIILSIQGWTESADAKPPAIGVVSRVPGTSFTIKCSEIFSAITNLIIYWEIKEND